MNEYVSNYMWPALAEDAIRAFDSFELDEITEDQHAAVIVDTIVSEYGGGKITPTTLRRLGADIDSLGLSDEDLDDPEMMNEVLEEQGESAADKLNYALRKDYPDEWRSFYFSWHDGGFYLFFGGDVNDAPDVDESE